MNLVGQAVLRVRCTECLHVIPNKRVVLFIQTNLYDDALVQVSCSCSYTALMGLDPVDNKLYQRPA